jgi:hypothetical protein
MQRLTQGGGSGIKIGDEPKDRLQKMETEVWERKAEKFCDDHDDKIIYVPFMSMAVVGYELKVTRESEGKKWIVPHESIVVLEEILRHPQTCTEEGLAYLVDVGNTVFKMFQVQGGVILVGNKVWEATRDIQAEAHVYEKWCPTTPLSEIQKIKKEEDKQGAMMEDNASTKRKAERHVDTKDEEAMDDSDEGEGQDGKRTRKKESK